MQGLAWETEIIITHRKKIDLFISLSEGFETSLLLGNYDEAEKLLFEISDKTGTSLYWVEKQFLLAQLRGGISENKALLNSYSQKNVTFQLLFICQFFSQKAEVLVNHENLKRSLQSQMHELEKEHPLRDYLHTLLGVGELKYPAYYLSTSAGLTLVDRYLAVLKVLRYRALEELDDGEVGYIRTILTTLSEAVNDPKLDNLKDSYSSSMAPRSCLNANRYQTALDEFSMGNFDNAAKIGAELIHSAPSSYPFYEITAKALAYAKNEFKPITSNDSLVNRITQYLYTLFKYETNIHYTLGDLEALSLNLGENNLSLSILNRVLWERDGVIKSNGLKSEFLTCIAPVVYDCLHHRDIFDQETTLAMDATEHPSIQLLKYRFGQIETSAFTPGLSNSIIFKVLMLQRELHLTNMTRVIELSDKLLKEDENLRNSLKLRGKVLDCRFQALFAQEQYREAMSLVTENYSTNTQLLRHTKYQKLLDPSVLNKVNDVYKCIDLPIIEYLLSTGTQEVYQAVNRYFRSIKCARPSEFLKDHSSTIPKAQLRIFLKDVLSMKVISRGFRYATSTQGLEDERATILAHLYAAESESTRKAIEKEITALSKKRLTRETLKKVSSSQLDVDTQTIKDSFVALSTLEFERYAELRRLAESDKIENNSQPLQMESEGLINRDINASTSELLFTLFTTILGDFLFDTEKSLNQCLSDKIRHGPIGNHIRRPFEQNHLLYKRNGHEKVYEPNGYWKQYGATDKVLRTIDSMLSTFSASINGLARTLKNDVLQFNFKHYELRDPSANNDLFRQLSKETGIFDYSPLFEWPEHLYKRLSVYSDPRDFSDATIEIVWEHTEQLLNNVKSYLKTVTVKQAGDALDELATATENPSIPVNLKTELMHYIQNARNSFEAEITHISSWFNMPVETDMSDISLNNLVETVRSLINSCTGEYLSNLFIDIPEEIYISGCHTSAVYDVIYILLQNIAVHSEVLRGKLVGRFVATLEEQTLTITVENSVEKAKQLSKSITRARELIDRLKSGDIDFRYSAKEGSYGIIKIWSTLSRIAGECNFEIDIIGTNSQKFIVQLKVNSNDLFKINTLY
jgi:hypothetical protein